MENKYREITQRILSKEIYRAEKMVAYAMEFDDKTAVGRWKMTVFQLKCLRKKFDEVFDLLQRGVPDEKIEELLDVLSKHLFMEGP